MIVQLSEEARRFIASQVASGRYPSEDALIEDAVARMRGEQSGAATPEPTGTDPILGLFRDDVELMDEIVEEAMRNRRERPWRLVTGNTAHYQRIQQLGHPLALRDWRK